MENKNNYDNYNENDSFDNYNGNLADNYVEDNSFNNQGVTSDSYDDIPVSNNTNYGSNAFKGVKSIYDNKKNNPALGVNNSDNGSKNKNKNNKGNNADNNKKNPAKGQPDANKANKGRGPLPGAENKPGINKNNGHNNTAGPKNDAGSKKGTALGNKINSARKKGVSPASSAGKTAAMKGASGGAKSAIFEGAKKIFMALPVQVKAVIAVAIPVLIIALVVIIFISTFLSVGVVTYAATCGDTSGVSYNGSDYSGSGDEQEFLCKMQHPLGKKRNYTVTSWPGPRWGRNHNGIDLAIAKGTPIYAVQAGVVVDVKDGCFDDNRRTGDSCGGGAGNHVYITHGGVITTQYMHMVKGSVKVKVGDTVGKGQLIGAVASSGNSTGNHLHFGMKIKNKFVFGYADYFLDLEGFKNNCGASWDGEVAGDSANAPNDNSSDYVATGSDAFNSSCCDTNITVSTSSGNYCKNGITVEGVGTIDLDEYVAGVVSAENAYKSSSDPDNIETMKAQAIAARTYAVNSTKNCSKKIGNSQSAQVYKEPSERALRASKETAGVVMTYKGDVFSSQYDAFCMNDSDCPDASCSGKTCTATYTRVPSNKTHKITVKAPHSANIYSGGLNGMGHARGMSQYVARQMQDEGKKFDEILKFFYADGIEISGVSNRCQSNFNGEIIYYNQVDYPHIKFCSGSDTIANSGCGATAMAIVTSSLLRKEVTPIDMRDLCCKWDLCGGNGTSWGFFEKAGNEYGLTVKRVSRDNSDEVLAALKSGNSLVVAHMGKGHFTNGGHYITLTGIKGAQVFVHDPGNGEKDGNNKYWDFDLIVRETKSKNDSPFWIVSK